MTDDVRKLLGGYATGTLSSEEKQLLFDAALHDDQLFAALADEHALKELLDDSGVRAQVLRATEEPRFTVAGAFRDWFERPKAKALAATGAVLLTVIGVRSIRQADQPEQQVAEVRLSPPAQPATGPASPPESKPEAAPVRRQALPARKFSTPEKAEAEQSAANPVVAQAPAPPPSALCGERRGRWCTRIRTTDISDRKSFPDVRRGAACDRSRSCQVGNIRTSRRNRSNSTPV